MVIGGAMTLWEMLPMASMPLDLLSYVLLTISVRRTKSGGQEASIGYFAAALAASAATIIYGNAKDDPLLYRAAVVSGVGQTLFFCYGLVAKKTFRRSDFVFCAGLVTVLIVMKLNPNYLDHLQFLIGLSKVGFYFSQRERIKRTETEVEIPTVSLVLFALCGGLMSAYCWHKWYIAPAIGVTFFCLGQLELIRKRFWHN